MVAGTVAFTVVANSARAAAARAAATAAHAGRVGWSGRLSQAALSAIDRHALTSGLGRAFVVAAGIMLLAALITAATIRIRKADLAGVNPI
jgi:hypothetical protein